MDSLTQYLSLYKEHSALVDKGSADIINRYRKEALDTLENGALPEKGS